MIGSNTKFKQQGFTIVELLVVIVVIGILSAITIVSYSGVTNKANVATNKSNAGSVASAADVIYAETNAWPPTSADARAELNKGVAKLGTGYTVGSTLPTATTSTAIGYVLKSPGYCVSYWDSTLATPGLVYIAGGGATCP